MSEILLATLNARYIHTAFGLRCLHANMGELQSRCSILEFDIKQRPADVAEELLAANPRIIGLGIYIWNVAPSTELVGLLKQLAPDVRIILGGPEVSYEMESQEIVRLADHVIGGEADLAFEWLERAVKQRDSGLTLLKVDPLLVNLRRDPRLAALVKRLHLER